MIQFIVLKHSLVLSYYSLGVNNKFTFQLIYSICNTPLFNDDKYQVPGTHQATFAARGGDFFARDSSGSTLTKFAAIFADELSDYFRPPLQKMTGHEITTIE